MEASVAPPMAMTFRPGMFFFSFAGRSLGIQSPLKMASLSGRGAPFSSSTASQRI